MIAISRRAVLASALAALPGYALAQTGGTAALAFDVEVPVDHGRPEAGRFPLRCEWGAPPKPGRPVVLLVADAQQYFVRPGGAARLQRELFGDRLNVLSIVGRSRSPALERLIMPAGEPDWEVAYRLLNWRQWAHDVEAVARHAALESGALCLYGRSGGAHLIHQLLALRPELESRAYVQAAVNHELDVRWGLGADRFWEEFSAAQPRIAQELAMRLDERPARRRDLVLILQRQHFFESLEALPAARLAAVRAFLEEDAGAIRQMRDRYQVDAIEQMSGTLEGVAGMIRIYEFAAPHRDPSEQPVPLRPDVEALFYYAEPLVEPSRRFAVPPSDWTRLRAQASQVLQVAGRHDHTCDYRTQIGLNGLTRHSRLILLDDNHVFRRWASAGTQPALLQAFFSAGADAPEFERASASLDSLLWRDA